jgi:Domain of unknown function (DUF4184)
MSACSHAFVRETLLDMPWTFAHPAAVLPLRHLCPRWLSFPALVVGSMMPDLGYYIRGADFATFAHTLAGCVLICVPAGFIVLGVLAGLRAPLCFLLPSPHREALTPLANTRLAGMPVLAASLVLGACTHVLWDAFTHQRGWIVAHYAWLQAPVTPWTGVVFPLFYWLQHGSTLAGVVLLALAYRSWLRKSGAAAVQHASAKEDRWRYRLLAAITATAAIAATVHASVAASPFPDALALRVFAREAAVSGVNVFAVLFGVCAVVVYIIKK